MSLIAQIKQAQLQSRKARQELQSTLLTTLIGEAEAVGKTAANRAPTDAEVLGVVRKFIKNCDFILEKVTDNQAITSAAAEKQILEGFLPKQLTQQEVETALENIIAINGIDGPKGLGKALKDMKTQYEGQYDAALASRIAKLILEK